MCVEGTVVVDAAGRVTLTFDMGADLPDQLDLVLFTPLVSTHWGQVSFSAK